MSLPPLRAPDNAVPSQVAFRPGISRVHPPVLTVGELEDLVRTVKSEGAFAFDVETRGFNDRHSEVMMYIQEEWDEKQRVLKSKNHDVLQRSYDRIYERWQDGLGLDTLRNEVFWIGVATRNRSWAIPIGHPNGEVLVPEERGDGSTIPPPGHRKILDSGKESLAKAKYFIPAQFSEPPSQLDRGTVFEHLAEIFFDPQLVMVGHNIKFDAKSIAKYYAGDLPTCTWFDTMGLMHIVDENLGGYSLERLCIANYHFNPWGKDKLGDRIQHEPFNRACHYVHRDARWTWMVFSRLWRRIENHGDWRRAADTDSALLPVLARMELNGIAVDHRAMKRVGNEIELEMNNLLLELSQHAPIGFNPDSTTDKTALLFGKKREGGLGLKPVKVTPKGKPSVDKEVLTKLSGEHPVVDLLLRWQELKKIKSTYIDGLRPQLHGGRLHPQFHIHRTDTGRLSSSDPNLQNIPRDGNVRSLFIAPPGESLIVADYDQIELRVMAMFSGDKNLTDIFVNGTKDIHTATACLVLGREYGDVTGEERTTYGKMPNFLMGYGGTAKLLSNKIGIPVEQAEEIVKGYKAAYSGLFEWKARMIGKARRHGYVTTSGGRWRRLDDALKSQDVYEQYRAERQAVNFIVQGTASEICKEAMVRVHEALDYPSCRMLVQVHDELVVSVPEGAESTWLPIVEDQMGNGTVIEGIPLKVSGQSARSWYDAKG